MDKKLHFKSLLLIVALLLGGGISAWAETVTGTYIFTAKEWTATLNGESANWTSNKNGGGYNNNGVQVTASVTGAGATSPISFSNISKIVVTYNTNKSAGAGSIDIKIGDNDATSNNVAFSGSADGRSANFTTEYNYSTPQSGNVTITVNTTTNSIYLCSIAITYDDGQGSSDTRTATSISFSGENYTEVYMDEEPVRPAVAVMAGETSIDGAVVTWESENNDVAEITESGVITLKKAGETKITASYAGDTDYKPSSQYYTLKVYGCYEGIEALQAAATTTSVPVKITFNNAIVTAVSGSNAYIVEGEKGALIYTNGHGLEAGKVINGTLKGAKLVIFKGATEITDFSSTDLTITDGTVPSAVGKTIGDLSANNIGLIVSIAEITYNATNKEFSDGTNVITFYDAFSQEPTFEDGKTYNVTGMVNYYNKLQISPLTSDVDVVNKTAPTSIWKVDGEEKSSVCVAKGASAPSFVFETDSPGDQSFVSDNEAVATVSDAGVITLKGTIGMATITASTAASGNYSISSATLTILVGEPVEDGVFNFAYQDYGSGVLPATSDNTNESTWTAGNVTMEVAGRNVWYNGQSLRFYKNNAGEGNPSNAGNLTFSVPSGYLIYKITGLSSILTPSDGSDGSSTWKGTPAQTISFTHNGGGTVTLETVNVYYTEPTVTVPVTDGYTSFCSDVQLDFSGTGVTVYKAKVNNSGSVHLTEVTDGKVPAGRGVILKAATAGDYTATVIEPVENLSNNELYGVTVDTEVPWIVGEGENAKYNYILQGGEFKKATGAKLKAGRAYLKTSYNVDATPESRLTIVVDGETTGIKTVKGDSDEQGVYDLQGRKVAQPAKGLYITNGKKFIVK